VSLSADGNTVIVGGTDDNSSAGAAWVWTRSGGVWAQQGTKLVGSGAVGPALQGSSVSLSSNGNVAVVGGPADNSSSGAAWVWTRSGGVWTQQGTKLAGSGAVGNANQGNSVALSADGNTAIEGGIADNSNTGAAWVFAAKGCAQDSTTLCLNNGRFAVSAAWRTSGGQSGQGQAVRLTTDTGYFTFFSATNVEVVVKVLDACGLNSRYWVFAGGLTDVNVVLTVRDTVTGTAKVYTNPLGTAFQPIQDTDAFATCSATGNSLAAPFEVPDPPEPTSIKLPQALSPPVPACTQDSTTICLNGDRFAVTATWSTSDGKSGQGQAVRLTADTGYFTFFSPTNVEVVIKVLNACGLNSTYWVFAGGLTNVNVVLTVRDVVTGIARTYTNAQGTAFKPIQDTSAFATCEGSLLESASAFIRSTLGGTITLPSGGTVSIAAGLLQSDENVSVWLLGAPPRQPSGSIAAVGTPVCIAFSPGRQTSPFAPPASVTATGVEVVLDLSRDSAPEMTGAVPFSELMVPSLPPDSRDVFLGVPGSVDVANHTATVDFSKALLDWFEVTRSGSTATVCAELANWNGSSNASSLRAPVPLASLPALLRFDGKAWVPAGPIELKEPGRTCVMVHGIFSSVENAFHADCMAQIQQKNRCDTVLGFNYRWWDQPIEQSANELVNALVGRGLHNVVIEGHSLGGVVAMTAIPSLRLNGLTIDHFVTLGSPMSGTPVVSNAQNLVTLLSYTSGLALLPALALNTFVNSIPIKDQLIPGSSFLTTARAAYLASTPKIPWTAVAGNVGELVEPLSAFLCDFVPCDGLTPVPSSLASDWPTPVVHPLPVFPTKHTGLECDPDVINAVGDDVNPFVPQSGVLSVAPDKLPFRMLAGGFVPSPLAFTITNSSQQQNSRLTYSVTNTQAWLGIGGPLITLGPGEATIFNASIKPSVAAALGAGTYADVITIADTTPSTIHTVPPLISSPSRTISVSLIITAQSSAPTVSSFTASPSTITRGQSSTLTWTTTNATSVSINGTVEPVSGSVSVSPTATTTYTLTATGPGGTASANATVTVNAASPPPTVVSFTATPPTITAGQTSMLSWTTANATSVSINFGVGSQPPNGSVPVSPAVTTTYTLTATGPGGTSNATTTVTVGSAGGVTGIAFVPGVGGFGAFVNGKITPAGLFGIPITCDWVGNLGSKATRTTSTLSSSFTCSNADVASWPDASIIISATVTGTTLTTSVHYP
jgi:hypothetical protein